MMKIKNILSVCVVCAVSFVLVSGSYSMASSMKEVSAAPAPATPAPVSQEIVPVVPAENKAEAENEGLQAGPQKSYQEILKAAPAMEGEHAELEDASFGYEQNLEKFGPHYDWFALADINQDGTPELLAQSVVNFRWTPISVYTYIDGNAVLLKDPLNPEAHGTFEQMSTAGGAYNLYICANHHVHNVWRGMTPVGEMEENQAYVLTGTILTATDCVLGENENNNTYFSDIAKPNRVEYVDAITQN